MGLDSDIIIEVIKGWLRSLGVGFFKLVLPPSVIAMLFAPDDPTRPSFFSDPIGWLKDVIIDWLYEQFLEPIAKTIWEAAMAVLSGFIFVLYGSDGTIGRPNGGQAGLFDLPFLITGPVGDTMVAVGKDLGSVVSSMNAPIIDAAQSLGIAAPVVTQILIITEIGLVVWGMWIAWQSFDIPGVRLQSVVKVMGSPVRRLRDWILQ